MSREHGDAGTHTVHSHAAATLLKAVTGVVTADQLHFCRDMSRGLTCKLARAALRSPLLQAGVSLHGKQEVCCRDCAAELAAILFRLGRANIQQHSSLGQLCAKKFPSQRYDNMP